MRSPKEILSQYWRFSHFRGSQEHIIEAILQNKDVLALLPTGGGKSICYQVPALAREGICIVISPLIALIQNQVDQLKTRGIKAVALTGGIPYNELSTLLDNCLYGNYKFLYLSPERLQQDIVQERIQKMRINLIAIDEAHCISQWGHDFRPAYLTCSVLRELAPETPIIALTATATEPVAIDIKNHLKFIETIIFKDSFLRSNIAFSVCWEEDKRYKLKQLCLGLNKSAIIYVRTRRLSQEITQYLNTNKLSATFFHGGISKHEKEKRLKQWLANDIKIMVATNAFGMGIDKPDVELVVHYQIPDAIENYFQEAGRAGRDGAPARAILITNKTDVALSYKQFIGVLPDVATLKLVYRKLNNYFQIAYGEGNDKTFTINFNEFCNTYNLNSLLTYNTLKLLDQHSVVNLNEAFTKKSTVQFIATKEQLQGYFNNNQALVTVVQTILRSYGGIFDFETKINVALIAKKSNARETRVLAILKQLEKDEIITYTAEHSDLEISFLVPREDDHTINVFAKQIKERHAIKKDNLNCMLNYISSDKTCRNKQLLQYFGESLAKDCQICDVCVENKPRIEVSTISQDILQYLRLEARTSRKLIAHLSYSQNAILKTLQELLEDEQIRINSKNEYEIVSHEKA